MGLSEIPIEGTAFDVCGTANPPKAHNQSNCAWRRCGYLEDWMSITRGGSTGAHDVVAVVAVGAVIGWFRSGRFRG